MLKCVFCLGHTGSMCKKSLAEDHHGERAKSGNFHVDL